MVTWMPLFDLAYLHVPTCDVGQVVECTVMTWNGLCRRGFSAEPSTICNAFAASMRRYLDPTHFPAMRLPKWKRGWISDYNPSKGVVLLLIGTMSIVVCLVASFVLKQRRRLRLRLLCFSIESTSSIYLFLASPWYLSSLVFSKGCIGSKIAIGSIFGQWKHHLSQERWKLVLFWDWLHCVLSIHDPIFFSFHAKMAFYLSV